MDHSELWIEIDNEQSMGINNFIIELAYETDERKFSLSKSVFAHQWEIHTFYSTDFVGLKFIVRSSLSKLKSHGKVKIIYLYSLEWSRLWRSIFTVYFKFRRFDICSTGRSIYQYKWQLSEPGNILYVILSFFKAHI